MNKGDDINKNTALKLTINRRYCNIGLKNLLIPHNSLLNKNTRFSMLDASIFKIRLF